MRYRRGRAIRQALRGIGPNVAGGLRPLSKQGLQGREVDSDDAPADADQLHDGRDSQGIGLFRVFQVEREAGRRGEEGVSDEIDEGFVRRLTVAARESVDLLRFCMSASIAAGS